MTGIQTMPSPPVIGDDAPGGDHRLPARSVAGGITYPWLEAPGPAAVVTLSRGIGWLRMPLPWALDHINLYLLPEREAGGLTRYALVDTGIRSPQTRRLWMRLARAMGAKSPADLLTRVLLTHHHPDHIGLAGWFADRFGLPVHASRICWLYAHSLWHQRGKLVPEEVMTFFQRAGFGQQALERIRAGGWGRYRQGVARLPIGMHRLSPDTPLVLGGVTWWPIETAGHAPGHISFYAPAAGILISGDQLLPEISSNVSVYPGEPYGNPLAEWLASLARLEALPADTLVLPAHNRPFFGLKERCRRLIARHLERLAKVADFCHEEMCSAIDVFPALYRRKVTGMEALMAAGEALAHLHFLEAEGVLARREGADGVIRFRALRRFDPAPVRERLVKLREHEQRTAPWLQAL